MTRLLLALSLTPILVHAGDWPNFRGPNFDGISEEALPDPLPDEPVILWKAKVGVGFSTVSVARGRVFTMGNADETDTVWCFDAETGELIWKHAYPCELDPRYYEGGPSATPTVHENAVYTFGKKGQVFRLDFETGEVVWERNLVKETGLELPEWSFASSPWIHEQLLILNAGGAGVALDRETGKTVWKSDAKAGGYATPVPFEDDILLFTFSEFVRLDPASGETRWKLEWDTGRGVNAADPIVHDDRILISSALGSALLDSDSEIIWKNKNMRSYFNAGVLIDGCVYNLHGTTHNPTELICLDWETGETIWSEPGFGSGALMAARDKLVLFDNGELTIFPASREGFKPLLRAQILGGKCWTKPVLANGLVYCRNAAGDLACVSLRMP